MAVGWAGNGEGKNNPAAQDQVAVGPLPRGTYRVDPWEVYHEGLGPMVAHLEQIAGDTLGRYGFYIHGASVHPERHGQESKGCIVLEHDAREKGFKMHPDQIQVVA